VSLCEHAHKLAHLTARLAHYHAYGCIEACTLRSRQTFWVVLTSYGVVNDATSQHRDALAFDDNPAPYGMLSALHTI
jgi:hypothetical protein